MYHPTLNQTLRCAGLLLPMVLLAACGGHKKVAKAETPAETPVVEVKTPELDGRGSYRFLMSNGDKKMTADEFDAWMKANGIRVAKGNGQDAAAKPRHRRRRLNVLGALSAFDNGSFEVKEAYLQPGGSSVFNTPPGIQAIILKAFVLNAGAQFELPRQRQQQRAFFSESLPTSTFPPSTK